MSFHLKRDNRNCAAPSTPGSDLWASPADCGAAIDLIDGQELASLLKQYELGVKTVMVERVMVDGEWFGSI